VCAVGTAGLAVFRLIIYLCLTGSEASYRRHCYCRDPQARSPPSGLGHARMLGRSRALGHARALLAGVEARGQVSVV